MLCEEAWGMVSVPLHPSGVQSGSDQTDLANHVFMNLAFWTRVQTSSVHHYSPMEQIWATASSEAKLTLLHTMPSWIFVCFQFGEDLHMALMTRFPQTFGHIVYISVKGWEQFTVVCPLEHSQIKYSIRAEMLWESRSRAQILWECWCWMNIIAGFGVLIYSSYRACCFR